MNWGLYGILIIFVLFALLLIFNPNISCFGRSLKSPLYPFFRKKKKKKIKFEDYGFSLTDDVSEKNSEKDKKEYRGFE